MRKYIIILSGIISLALVGTAQAQNFQRGGELFEHQCHGCHDDLRLAAKAGKVKSLKDLRKKIGSWAEHGGTQWGNSEVDDVLNYLNKSFYHFKGKAL
jgi:mono/diheme cytochrome c family protein